MFDNYSMTGSAMLGAEPVPQPFEVDLQTYLQANLQAVIRPGHIDRNDTTYPQVTYLQVTYQADVVLGGVSGLATARYQFDVWSPNFLDCIVTAERLRRCLSGFRGYFGSTFVKESVLADQRGGYEAAVDESDAGLHRKMSDFVFTYVEPAVVYPVA